jgi:hypothetical protein
VCDKSDHKIGGDLSRFLFCYGVWRILITGIKNVFQCDAVLGSASETKRSTDMAGVASKRVIRIEGRQGNGIGPSFVQTGSYMF